MQNLRIFTSGFRLWDLTVCINSLSIYILMTSFPDTDINMQEFLPPCFLKYLFSSHSRKWEGGIERDRVREAIVNF